MKSSKSEFAQLFLKESQHSLASYHMPRLVQCLRMLSEKEIWWRPNAASNSAGNLALHLSGNVRQWIISGLGKAPDHRDRDREFAERGPIPRRSLIALLRKTVDEACSVLGRLSEEQLLGTYDIQGFHVSGLYAASQVVTHFAYHTGQIIFATKLKLGKDLRFTHLPGEKHKTSVARVP
jgi:uncharacterized damage-inducible protein DinB